MFTQVRSADRRVAPVEGQSHKSVMKAVYVVLEPQYQNALTQAANALNASGAELGIELSGYLIEELRDDDNYADFCADVAEADVFIASLIFIEDLAQKVVDAVAPHRERLKAAVVFPSMPEVMRLNKLGSFSMAQLGQSKSAIAGFMKKRKEAGGLVFKTPCSNCSTRSQQFSNTCRWKKRRMRAASCSASSTGLEEPQTIFGISC